MWIVSFLRLEPRNLKLSFRRGLVFTSLFFSSPHVHLQDVVRWELIKKELKEFVCMNKKKVFFSRFELGIAGHETNRNLSLFL